MSDEALQVIYMSVILRKLLYASSVWWGLTSGAVICWHYAIKNRHL